MEQQGNSAGNNGVKIGGNGRENERNIEGTTEKHLGKQWPHSGENNGLKMGE